MHRVSNILAGAAFRSAVTFLMLFLGISLALLVIALFLPLFKLVNMLS